MECFRSVLRLPAPGHGRSMSGDVATNEPYTDGVTAEALIERVEGQHRTHSRPRQAGQDYAFAVSSDEGPPSVDGSLDDGDSAVGRELSWVAVLPECDRRAVRRGAVPADGGSG